MTELTLYRLVKGHTDEPSEVKIDPFSLRRSFVKFLQLDGVSVPVQAKTKREHKFPPASTFAPGLRSKNSL